MSAIRWLPHAATGGVADHYARYLAGEAVGVGDAAHRCPDLDALTDFARARRGARIAEPLASALAANAARLGGTGATARAIAECTAGEAVLVFAGQQPGLLAGPLYTLHKAATAVATARAITAGGVRAYPAFWIAADDSDLDETGTAYAPGPDRGLRKARLAEGYAEGTLAGDVPVTENDAALERLFPDGPTTLVTRIGELNAASADLGDFLAVLLHRAFGADGIVPVDSRTPALREAAAPLVRRYLDVHAAIATRIDAAGEAMERDLGIRPVHEASAASALFAIEDGRRVKLESPEAARGVDPTRLSAGVVLRPFVQEHVFPTAGFVVGPGELAYLLQSEVASDLLGVTRSPFIPRLMATWVDETLAELAALAEGGWGTLFADPAPVVERRVREELPAPLRDALEALRAGLDAGFAEIAAFAEREGDRALAQIGEASRKKADYQVGRVESQAMDRARKAAAKRGLVLTNVAEFLRPRNGGQERTMSALWPLGTMDAPSLGARIAAAADHHLETLSSGESAHALIPLEGKETLAKEESWGERCESA